MQFRFKRMLTPFVLEDLDVRNESRDAIILRVANVCYLVISILISCCVVAICYPERGMSSSLAFGLITLGMFCFAGALIQGFRFKMKSGPKPAKHVENFVFANKEAEAIFKKAISEIPNHSLDINNGGAICDAIRTGGLLKDKMIGKNIAEILLRDYAEKFKAEYGAASLLCAKNKDSYARKWSKIFKI